MWKNVKEFSKEFIVEIVGQITMMGFLFGFACATFSAVAVIRVTADGVAGSIDKASICQSYANDSQGQDHQ